MRESRHALRGCRQSHVLHVRLKDLYRRAKDLAKTVRDRGPPDGPDERIVGMESEVLAIADTYEILDNRFCTTLQHAAPHMFVFVRYPHMAPTNNLAERIVGMESEVLAIADTYEILDNRFCTTLQHAAPHMFVFVRYPHMAPTNNLAERMIRLAVVARKVRGKIVTPGCMEMLAPS